MKIRLLAICTVFGCGPTATQVGSVSDSATAHTSATSEPLAASQPGPSKKCPSFVYAGSSFTVQSSKLNEISGVEVSRTQPYVYVHEDSGSEPKFYALDPTGKLHATYELKGAQAHDWEDMSQGPGPVAGVNYLYFGDIGDNDGERPYVYIHRVREPQVELIPGRKKKLMQYETFALQYPGGQGRDSEGFFVDEKGRVILFSKRRLPNQAFLFELPEQGNPQKPIVGRRIANVPVLLITAAALSPKGRMIAVRHMKSFFFWERGARQSLRQAMQATPCRVPLRLEKQGEALGFIDEDHFVTISEGKRRTLHVYSRQKFSKYDHSKK